MEEPNPMPYRHHPAPVRRKTTPAEWIIVAAIIGILFSAAVPVITQAARRARAAGFGQASQEVGAPAREGQYNTIEMPDTARPVSRPTRPSRPRTPGFGFGAIFNLIIFGAILSRVIKAVLRRKSKQSPAPSHHDEDPDA